MWANTAFFFPRKGLFFLKLQDFYIKTLYFCGPHQTEAPCVDFRLPRLLTFWEICSQSFLPPLPQHFQTGKCHATNLRACHALGEISRTVI